MSTIIIRPVQPPDWQAYRDLRLEALRYAPTAFGMAYETEAAKDDAYWQERIAKTLHSDIQAMFVADHDGILVGMMGMYRDDLPKLRHAATLIAVYVRPVARGQGITDRLIEACMNWAQAHKVRFVRLAVETANIYALRVYLRNGFRVYATDPEAIFHDGAYYDELLLRRMVSISSSE